MVKPVKSKLSEYINKFIQNLIFKENQFNDFIEFKVTCNLYKAPQKPSIPSHTSYPLCASKI